MYPQFNHQTISTSIPSYSPPIATARAVPPLKLVGLKRLGAEYWGIYDFFLSSLENRRIQFNGTGQISRWGCMHPRVREILISEGMTPLEVERLEQFQMDASEILPSVSVLRSAPASLYSTLMKTGQEDQIFDSRIVSVPGPMLNALACEKLLTLYSRQEVLSTPGFIEVDVEFEGERSCVVRLDVDAWMVRQGFIVPVVKGNRTIALKVFRRPSDTRPFILRSREVGLNA